MKRCVVAALLLHGSGCAAVAQDPPPEGFFFELGAGFGGCGGDGCIASDEGSIELDLAGGWAFVPWLGTDVRFASLLGDVGLLLGSAELVLSPFVGSPVEIYAAAGPAAGFGDSEFGGGTSLVRRSWEGLATALRIGANLPTSFGGWGFFTSRVVAFGTSRCTATESYYEDTCAESRDVAPQFWLVGVKVTAFP